MTEWNYSIPKKLFQFWHDRDEIPEYVRRAMTRTRALHPDYEYVLADDSYMVDFIRRRHGECVLNLYTSNSIRASRSDLARLMLLIEHGGFYLDATKTLRMPFHSLVEPDVDLLLMSWLGQPHNGVIGAIRNHGLLARILELALRNLDKGYFNRDVAFATGPICMRAAIDHFGALRRARWVQRDDVLDAVDNRENASLDERWQLEQWRGIRRPDAQTQAFDRDGEREEPIDATLGEEADYFEAIPSDGLLVPPMAAVARSWLNEFLTGDPNSSWLDDVATRGPFPCVAILTLASTAGDLDFLRRVQAKSVAIFSPRPVVLDAHRTRLAQSGLALEVEFHHCDMNRPDLPGDAFDLVLSEFFLHRVPDHEVFFRAIEGSLRAHGLLAFLEYVGEDRFQFTVQQRALVTGLLDALAAIIPADVLPPVTCPSPSEYGPHCALRSSRILPTASTVFEARHLATCLAALMPLLVMRHPAATGCIVNPGARAAARAYERKLLLDGEAGTVAYGVYGKRPV